MLVSDTLAFRPTHSVRVRVFILILSDVESSKVES